MKLAKIGMVAAACALALTIVGCSGGESSYAQTTLDEVSGVKVEATNAGDDMEATTEGAIVVKEGDVIVISPVTEKGSFHLTISSHDTGTFLYDQDVEGRVLFTIEAAPGTYDVETHGNDVTGEMTVFAQSAQELAAQDAALAEATEGTGAGN